MISKKLGLMFALLRESLQMNTRRDVLRLYKSLLKLSKEWVAKEASKTEAERQAIKVSDFGEVH